MLEEMLIEIGTDKKCPVAVMVRDGKVLAGLRNYTKDKWKEISVWTLPGGRCDAHETLEQTLRRETAEEVGITDFMIKEVREKFVNLNHYFLYDEKQSANVYFLVRQKDGIIKIGPPIGMKKHVAAFRKANKKVFVKNGTLFANIKGEKNSKTFLQAWISNNKNKMKEMGIVKLVIL